MVIFTSLRRRLPWFSGLLLPWSAAWLALGLRQVPLIKDTPHPFLQGLKITGVMLEALRDWALLALLTYVLVGILTGLIVLIWTGLGHERGRQIGSLSFREGLGIGAATLCWSHGILFLMVPATLGSVGGLNRLPVGFVLLILFGTGALLLHLNFASTRKLRPLRWVACLASLSALFYLPHDLFRVMAPAPSALPALERRLLVLGVDGMKKDLVDQAYRRGGAPPGVQPICAVPATRMAWNSLLGGDPDQIVKDLVMPYRSEIENPGRLTLLEYGRERGLRVSFVIDDSLTPTYGLQPTYFSEVLEPSGGWKHWFSLGLGHTWPVYSWAENYFNATETNNPWADPRAFFRDVTRAVRRNQWTNAHLCQLHQPIFPRFSELQRLKRWTWLSKPSASFIPYQTQEGAARDQYRRAGPLSDPSEHYILRGLTVLAAMRPFLDRWSAEFPNLSGVFTADHGESHVAMVNEQGKLVTHFPGVHGFLLDADSTRIPMYPFGKTETHLPSGTVYSWFNLRDDIGHWVAASHQPLVLTGDNRGWLIKAPTLRPTHMEGASKSMEEADERGIRPDELASLVFLTPMGTWFSENPPPGKKPWKLSTALALGEHLVTFNPSGKGKQVRTEYKGYALVSVKPVTDEEVEKEVQAFNGHRPTPWMPPQLSRGDL